MNERDERRRLRVKFYLVGAALILVAYWFVRSWSNNSHVRDIVKGILGFPN